jgi:hypothetical protein
MVTGVEEEMKVTSNDDKKQQDKQPTETRQPLIIKISQSQPFYFAVPTFKFPPKLFYSLLFCLSSARCLSPL